MRLVSFRIKKYRSIEDSGEIKVDENITAFVGVNESGKTNLMRALKKISHVNETDFDSQTENPAWYDEDADPGEVFVTATFKLNDEEKQQIMEISHETIAADMIQFSKRKDMKTICHLGIEQNAVPFAVFRRTYLQPVFEILNAIDPTSLTNGQRHKAKALHVFNIIGRGCENKSNIRHPDILVQIKKHVVIFKESLDTIPGIPDAKNKINLILNRIDFEIAEDSTEAVKDYLINNLPRLIYFENIGIIDSRIHLPTLVSGMDSGGLSEEQKMAKTILDLGGLDPKELLHLGTEVEDHEQMQRNNNRLHKMLIRASKKVSKEINRIWSQNEHGINFVSQGNYLRVWITNKENEIELQMEERSRGYQWYLSFYSVFSVESKGRYKDAIILLEEPALFLHAKGQQDFRSNVLPKIAEQNQILYTTHSPFMIDVTKPDSIHTVTLEDQKLENGMIQKTTHISNDVWSSDRDALFPLQAALGYTMAQSMFIGRKNLIVEGMLDLWLLKGVSIVLEAAGKTYLKSDIIPVPAGGASHAEFYASTYRSQGLDVAVLLDADRVGKEACDSIVRKKILSSTKVFTISKILSKAQDMSIEDIFSEDYYLQFVKSAYKKELDEKGITDIDLNSQKPMIVQKIKDYFKEKDLGEFRKGKPDHALIVELGKKDIGSLPPALVKNAETIFEQINKIL